MKYQQVNVDYWAMLKAMFVYGALTGLGWLMLRLFNTVFMLPRRLRAQQENIQNSLQELQKRFPDLNITEEDLINAEKELEELTKETEDNNDKENEGSNESSSTKPDIIIDEEVQNEEKVENKKTK